LPSNHTHLAVALEGQDVRGDAVQEPAIVADDDGAAGEVEQGLLERAQRVHVEVVRGLVEEEQVAAGLRSLARCTRLRSPPDSTPTFSAGRSP
jgi:hypothetical protein